MHSYCLTTFFFHLILCVVMFSCQYMWAPKDRTLYSWKLTAEGKICWVCSLLPEGTPSSALALACRATVLVWGVRGQNVGLTEQPDCLGGNPGWELQRNWGTKYTYKTHPNLRLTAEFCIGGGDLSWPGTKAPAGRWKNWQTLQLLPTARKTYFELGSSQVKCQLEQKLLSIGTRLNLESL